MRTITRAEYDGLRSHGYAGRGTPLNPNAPGHWVLEWVDGQGTTLRTGVEIALRPGVQKRIEAGLERLHEQGNIP